MRAGRSALSAAAVLAVALTAQAAQVRLEVLENGAPAAAADFDVFIRSRAVDPPAVVAEGHNRRGFDLAPGRYDCLVIHRHVLTEPVRFHFFEVRGPAPVVVRSEVRTHWLVVVPRVAGEPAWERAVRTVVTGSPVGDRIELRGAGPLRLPEGQYRVRLEARDESGAALARERGLYLACDEEIGFDL